MTLGLTPRLQELASFIRSYLAANDGIGPTHDEMKAAIGLKSKSGVARMVNELEERGVITRKKYGSRSIMITDDGIGAAVAAERERCAQIAEGTAEYIGGSSHEDLCRKIAAAIRNRN